MLERTGKDTHMVIGTIIIIIPTVVNGTLFDIIGNLISLRKSLTASAKGTIKPMGPGLLGPFRM